MVDDARANHKIFFSSLWGPQWCAPPIMSAKVIGDKRALDRAKSRFAQQFRLQLYRSLTFPGYTSRTAANHDNVALLVWHRRSTKYLLSLCTATHSVPARSLRCYSVSWAIAGSIFTLLHLGRQQKEAQRCNFKGKSIKRQCMCPV